MSLTSKLAGALLGLMWFAMAPVSALAAEKPPWQSPGDRADLVRDLRALEKVGRKKRIADPKYLDEMRILADRYTWPWSKRLLRDRFADGDYKRNPKWTVRSGKFWVDRNMALRTTQAGAQPAASEQSQGSQQNQQGDVGRQIIGSVLQEILKPQNQGGNNSGSQQAQQESTDRAELSIARPISAAFDLRIALASRKSPGRFEIGPYLGNGNEGYRLAYIPGGKPSLAILRYSNWGSAVIDATNKNVKLEDGRVHHLEWLRLGNGEMAVFVDGKEMIRTSDRSFKGAFGGLVISNLGGEFAVRSIEVLGTP